MRKPRILIALISLFLISQVCVTSAATKALSADIARKNFRCNQPNQISFSAAGALICSGGSWKLIPSTQDNVATRAYRSLLARYNTMPAIQPNLLIRVDPSAGNWKDKIVKGFVAAARLWGTSTASDQTLPLYISERAEFVTENLVADGIQENPEDAKRNRDAVAQGHSQAGSHGTYFDFLFSAQNSHDNGFYQVGPHEYTHFAQKIFSSNRVFQVPREFWIEEGCAQFVGTSMGGLIELPQNQRETIVQHLQTGTNTSKLAVFSNSTPAMYANPKFKDVYDIGSIGCEALVAVAGIDSLEKLYRELSIEETTFDSATNKVFRMSLENLVSFSQGYVDSVRINNPLSLSNLNRRFKALQSS